MKFCTDAQGIAGSRTPHLTTRLARISTQRLARTSVSRRTFALALATLCLSACCGCALVSTTEPEVELTQTLAAGLTIEEGTLTVGVNSQYAPYAGTNSDGELVGLDVDFAALLSDEFGVKVSVVDVGTEGKQALLDGTVDVVLGVEASSLPKKLTGCGAYLHGGAALFAPAGSGLSSASEADFNDAKVIVVSGSNAATVAVNALGYTNLMFYESTAAAVEALNAAEGDFLIADAVVGSYYAADYSTVEFVGYLGAEHVTNMCSAVLAANEDLANAVTEAIAHINEVGTSEAIAIKWLGTSAGALLPQNVDTSALSATFSPTLY